MSARVVHRIEDGIGWIEFGAGQGSGPVFDSTTLAELRAAIDAIAQLHPVAIVIASAAPGVFSHGADLEWLASLRDPAAASEYSRKGQRLMEAIESLGPPTVCAIHGACAGPGLEVALACQSRVASDAGQTRIGFGEVSSHMIPCWGGCVRLPRLVGAQEALERIIGGGLAGASDALRLGYVDLVVPEGRLRAEATRLALEAARFGPSLRISPQPPDPGLFARLRDLALRRPADRRAGALAAIEVVERSVRLQKRAAWEIETQAFGQLTLDALCRQALADAASRRPS